MSIRAKHAHFTNWAKVCEGINNVIVNNEKVNNITTEDAARTFLINTNNYEYNPFYYMVCYIKDTKEIYTHGTFYSANDLREIVETLSANFEDFEEEFNILKAEVEENEEVAAKALSDLNDNKANKAEVPTALSELTNDVNFVDGENLNILLQTKQNLLTENDVKT